MSVWSAVVELDLKSRDLPDALEVPGSASIEAEIEISTLSKRHEDEITRIAAAAEDGLKLGVIEAMIAEDWIRDDAPEDSIPEIVLPRPSDLEGSR